MIGLSLKAGLNKKEMAVSGSQENSTFGESCCYQSAGISDNQVSDWSIICNEVAMIILRRNVHFSFQFCCSQDFHSTKTVFVDCILCQ